MLITTLKVKECSLSVNGNTSKVCVSSNIIFGEILSVCLREQFKKCSHRQTNIFHVKWWFVYNKVKSKSTVCLGTGTVYKCSHRQTDIFSQKLIKEYSLSDYGNSLEKVHQTNRPFVSKKWLVVYVQFKNGEDRVFVSVCPLLSWNLRSKMSDADLMRKTWTFCSYLVSVNIDS